MKKHLLVAALLLSLSLNAFLVFSSFTITHESLANLSDVHDALSGDDAHPRDDDWEAFITALAWVESRWTDDAESSKQAVGYLQITPVLVKDANRIVGREEFTLEGRLDRQESIRLFNVIMDNYNPEHDLQFALKIWNPYSKVSYHRAVMTKYKELKNKSC